MVGPKKGTPVSGTPGSSKKRKIILDSSDDESTTDISPGAKLRKVNRHGLVTLDNGVISMKALALADSIPTKHTDPDARPLHGARLSLGQAWSLFTLVKCGHQAPAEKIRDQNTRVQILLSAQPYSISEDQLSEILDAGKEERQAFLHGLSKAAQQKLRYNMYGTVANLFNRFVFTNSGVQPNEKVKLHLGLKDLVPERCVMEMWVSNF